MLLTEQAGEAVDVMLVGGVEEEVFGLDGLMTLEVATIKGTFALALGAAGHIVGKERLLGLAGELETLVVDYSVVTTVFEYAVGLEYVVAATEVAAKEVALAIVGVEAVDEADGDALVGGVCPLGIVVDCHEQQGLDMDILMILEDSLTQGQLGIGLDELEHPEFVVLEPDVVTVEIAIDMFLELIDELLLCEAVDFLWYEALVILQGCNYTRAEAEPHATATNFVDGTLEYPALGDELSYLLGIDHNGEA
jgi:hypothetical protein